MGGGGGLVEIHYNRILDRDAPYDSPQSTAAVLHYAVLLLNQQLWSQSRHPKRKKPALEGGRSKYCNLPHISPVEQVAIGTRKKQNSKIYQN